MPRRNLVLIFASAIICLVCYRTSARNPYGRYFEEVVEQINARYVKDVDQQSLFDAAVRGMMSELDENSAFIGRTDAPEFQQALDGEFGGIGIEVSKQDDSQPVVVLSPIVGTPAYAAGILSGDQILEVDGRSTVGMTRNDAVELMRGKPGEPVRLKVLHKGDEEPVEMTIERAIIQVDSVLGDTRGPDGTQNYYLEGYPHLAYIRISTFGAKTVEEMRAALSQVQERGSSALILDLRYNPGGLLNSAVEISDMFIDEGVIVSIKGRNHELRDQHEATRGGMHSSLPMVVLINKYSASASEIVAAALQDHGRAVVIGERSYGKGTVQNIIEVEGGRSVLKLTTADYWRPSNRNIHRHKDAKETDEWGVIPDSGFLVEMDDEQIKQAMRRRQERDMLRNDPEAAESAAPDAILSSDPQLRRAVEYLQEKLNKAGPKNAA